MAKTIMIQGTMSDAGKSILAAALCRIFTLDGYKVAPFKSQNMALNSFSTSDGKEIGRAQAMQAQACKTDCDVRMNPVLLKPLSNLGSQVVVMGKSIGTMTAKDYFSYRKKLMPKILDAYNSLAKENDIVVIEGAGSPAELNLKRDDIVNMGLAKAVNAPVLLVADIDRGGVFAQLYGTVKLLSQDEQNRIEGLVVNKFRGDEKLFSDGIDILEEKCQKDVLGLVPYINDLRIDGEDSLALEALIKAAKQHKKENAKKVAVVKLDHISNYTDFAPLAYRDDTDLSFTTSATEIKAVDIVIIPGTKNTIGDLVTLKKTGLDKAIHEAAQNQKTVLGICGGYQMLGEMIEDSNGIEGDIRREKGLGLLPVHTTMTASKKVRRIEAVVEDGIFSGKKDFVYEIHNGVSKIQNSKGKRFARLSDGTDDGCVCRNVYGTYLHGLFDTKGENELQYERLAGIVRNSLNMEKIYAIMERYQ